MQTSPLDLHVSFWLRAVSNHVSHALGTRMQPHGVTVAEWSLLRLLHDAPQRPTVIAARLGLTRSAISKLSDRLAAKNLIASAPTPGDLRSQSLSLTRQGRDLVPVLAKLADDNEDMFFGHLGHEHQETLRLLMRNILNRRRARQPGRA
ncbi:MAG: MarR family winged helix-turn-helix transcriptional regulator [Beijerinckiaceae bacterium]